MGIWSVLGIEPTQDIAAIKRAYAHQLKSTRPDQDPQAYQRLREAFESARRGEYFWTTGDNVTYSSHPASLTDDSLINQTQVHHLVSEIVSLLLENEQAGLEKLQVCLSETLLQNLQLREMFSQQLAWDLAEHEGLTFSLLANVAALMEWEIDHYQPVGISVYQLDALHQQIESTAGRHYWDALRTQLQASGFGRKVFDYLSVEGKNLTFGMKCVPGFVGRLRAHLHEIAMYHPVLLPRVNSRLRNDLKRCRFALSGEATFLTVFWCVLAIYGARHSPHWLRDTLLSAITVLGCIFGYKGMGILLHPYPRLHAVAETLMSVLVIALSGLVFSGFYATFLYLQDDPGRGPALFFMLLITVLFCTWAICPKSWRWYNLVCNSVVSLLTLPWEQARKPGRVRRVVACALMLFVYSWLITWAVE